MDPQGEEDQGTVVAGRPAVATTTSNRMSGSRRAMSSFKNWVDKDDVAREGAAWGENRRHDTPRHSFGRLLAATLLAFVRVIVRIIWQLLGYLFEAIMVVLTIIPALIDVSVCLVSFCVYSNSDRGKLVDFQFTRAYGQWLSETYMIAFETGEGRQQRRKVKKAEKVFRRQLFQKIVTNGILKSALARSIDVGQIDPATTSIVFVFTDIEHSTEAQLQSPQGYQQAVLKHDIVMREALYAHRGLEIDTEGDAFRLGFAEVTDAVLFCMDLQERLLQVKWPKLVLKIPAFKAEVDGDGNRIWAGPRVRMGIHLALPGSFEVKLNLVTQKPVISGIAWEVALSLGDCGRGGQILIADTVYSVIQHQMANVGFPTTSHLGTYSFESDDKYEMDVFEIRANDSEMLQRKFSGPLRRCKLLAEPAANFGTSRPPQGDIALVGLRASQYNALNTQPSLTSFRMDRAAKKPEMVQVSEANRSLLVSTIQAVAQQFRGFVFKTENMPEEYCYFAFGSVADASRFCIALQATLLCSDWPEEPNAQFIDGNLLYRGPTVACAIVTAQTDAADFYQILGREHEHLYEGSAVDGLCSLLGLCHVGQVVLSHRAWRVVQFLLGELNQPFVIDLGVHQVNNLHTGQVVELLPREFKGRVFPDLSSQNCLAPGARQSPVSKEGVAFVFTSPVLDTSVAPGLADEMVGHFTELTRQIVYSKKTTDDGSHVWYGYECQEVGAGNFMLAFSSLDHAMTYAGNITEALLKYGKMMTSLSLCCVIRSTDISFAQSFFQTGPQRCSRCSQRCETIPTE